MIRHGLDGLWGVYELLRLAVITRFNFKGEYWQWRMHTAYGRGYPATRWALWKATLEYGVWVHRMRRG
ncbi:MAG: hypothetical protein MUE97_00430 [Phycisphaerales bacterium]|nr:hypothetical protein [Phycisphaerales bacterium]